MKILPEAFEGSQLLLKKSFLRIKLAKQFSRYKAETFYLTLEISDLAAKILGILTMILYEDFAVDTLTMNLEMNRIE